MSVATLSDVDDRDRRFFRASAAILAAVLAAGFIVQLALGRSSFSAPLIVHAHAVVFMGWIPIVLAQFHLATSGRLDLHRNLGRLAVVWALAMLALGPLVTLAGVRDGRPPFVFQPQHFLLVNPAMVLGFAGLLAAAVALRKRTDWHARLQIGAFVMLVGPGLGRLLPLPLLTPFAYEIAAAAPLLAVALGMARDWRVHGRVHPAWFWSAGVLIGLLIAARLLAFSPAGDAIYAAAIVDAPAALVDGRAFPPAPGAP